MPTPPKKKAKQDHSGSPFLIEKLPEALLAKIFSYLPLKQRFQIAATCKQWLGVSRIPWADISHLNASCIPNAKLQQILDLCPKIAEFVAHERTLPLDDPERLFGCHLRSLRLYDVKLSCSRRSDTAGYRGKLACLSAELLGRLPNLEELVWYLVRVIDKVRNTQRLEDWPVEAEIPISGIMAASLRRLKIVGSGCYEAIPPPDITPIFRQLVNLECLHLEGFIKTGPRLVMKHDEAAVGRFWSAFASLTKLRELCIAQVRVMYAGRGMLSLKTLARYACEHLPQLEVLIYASPYSIEPDGIAQLVTSHPALRILVLAGNDGDLVYQAEPFVVPPRKIHSRSTGNGLSSMLQVFVGGNIVRNVLFTLPATRTTRFWLIDCEMPRFLAKREVAEVFEGVWLAEMMREAVAVGKEDWVWGGRRDSNLFYTQAPRAGLRSRTAALDQYWPDAILRRGH